MHRRYLGVVITIGALLILGGCSDENESRLDDARETAGSLGDELEDITGQASARAVAETLRGAILADENDAVRSVDLLNKSVKDLPGEPEVTAITDDDGDGLDDDGLVEVRVGDQAACLHLSSTEAKVDVENGAC